MQWCPIVLKFVLNYFLTCCEWLVKLYNRQMVVVWLLSFCASIKTRYKYIFIVRFLSVLAAEIGICRSKYTLILEKTQFEPFFLLFQAEKFLRSFLFEISVSYLWSYLALSLMMLLLWKKFILNLHCMGFFLWHYMGA